MSRVRGGRSRSGRSRSGRARAGRSRGGGPRSWTPPPAAAVVTVAITVAIAATAVTAAAGSPARASPAGSLVVYREGPPTAHTGGFGEPTCAECHFGRPVDTDRGTLTVEAPTTVEPGRTYRIAVELAHPEMAAAGFQVALRFAGGESDGEQAGTLRSVGPRTAVTTDSVTGVQYGHQTPAGAGLSGAGETRWVLEWDAPTTSAAVVAHAAANAANDDASEFGDDIFTTRAPIEVRPRAAAFRSDGAPAR